MELCLKKERKVSATRTTLVFFLCTVPLGTFLLYIMYTRMRCVFVIHAEIPIWKFKTSFVTSRLYQGVTHLCCDRIPMILKARLPQYVQYIHTYCGIKYPKHRCNLKERSQETSFSRPGKPVSSFFSMCLCRTFQQRGNKTC